MCPRRVKPVINFLPQVLRFSGQWGLSLPPPRLSPLLLMLMPFLPCSKTSDPTIAIPSLQKNPVPGVLYQAPPLHCSVGRVGGRAVAGAKRLMQVFSILVNRRLLRKKRVEGWRWRNPVVVASKQHPYSWEETERKQCERNSSKSWVLCVIILYESKRKLQFLTESHLLALWHSGSLRLSLNETWLNENLNHVLYPKVFEEVSSLLKHTQALLQAILWSEALWCKSAITCSISVAFS